MNIKFLYTRRTLGSHLENPRLNNFGLIRLIAALMVMETHSHILTAEDNDFYYTSFHLDFLGLPIFFFLSGLLVTQSLHNSPSWKNFLWRRFLRIYPAPCLAILTAALIMGPLVTTCSLKDYFTSPILYKYLEGCSLVHINFLLPGVFTRSPLGTDSVNSSLWTIALELKLYLALLIAWLIKIPQKIPLLLLLLAAITITASHFLKQDAMSRLLRPWLTLGTHFLLGILAYLFKDKIVSRGYWLLLLPIAFLVSIRLNILYTMGFLLIPALVIFTATHGIRFLKKITPTADLSYGLYVFAFPVQQLVANYLHPANALILFMLSVVAALPLAILSWFGVEKRALRLKNRVR
ncbi:MAG TPA: acyltransferase [Puia sp.]